MFALVDCNSFYASCEKVFRPDLAHRPVAVLSNNDGCVIAATPDAKALGLTMGVPYFQAKPIIKRNNVAIFSSNYTLYGDLSTRVMTTLRQFATRMEVYSIDEAFLELREWNMESSLNLGDHIANTVRQWTGIPVCVGMGPTKTLAKAANRTAKRRGRRSFKMESPEQIEEALFEMAVQDVWGVSSRWMKRLQRMGIATALDLRKVSPMLIRKHFNIVLERTVRELNGEPCIALEEVPPKKKQIVVSRSFGQLVRTREDLEQAVATYAVRLGKKLRKQNSFAGGLYAWLATNPFREGDRQMSAGAAVPLSPATANSADLIRAALAIVRRVYRKGYLFKKAGVMALDIVNADASLAQGSLFPPERPRERDIALMTALDAVTRRHGADAVFFATQGVTRGWKMQRNLMSPYYTTRWTDLPRVG